MIKAGLRQIKSGTQFNIAFNNRLLSLLREKKSDQFTSLILGYGHGSDIDPEMLGKNNFLLDREIFINPKLTEIRNKKFEYIKFDLTGGGIEKISNQYQSDIVLPAIPLQAQSINFIYSSLNLTVNTPARHAHLQQFQQSAPFLYLIHYALIVQQIADMARLLKPDGYLSLAYHSHISKKHFEINNSSYWVPQVTEAKSLREIIKKGLPTVDARILLKNIVLESGYFKTTKDPWINKAEKKILIKDFADGKNDRIWLVRHKAFQRTDKKFSKYFFEKLDQEIYRKILSALFIKF